VQCIYAGPGGTIDDPAANGTAGGDDALLETEEYPGQFFTAIGEGFPFGAEGRFYEDFKHNLPAGARVYVRVWNGQAPASSTHYGTSGLYTLVGSIFEENDFGQWSTGTSMGGACTDLDEDGYGSPASVDCPHPELDCDDSNPGVNPGMTEIPGNGIDDDCNAGTPQWGTPASTVSRGTERATSLANISFLIVLPGAFALLWRRAGRKKKYGG
jgi:hypothetical protein